MRTTTTIVLAMLALAGCDSDAGTGVSNTYLGAVVPEPPSGMVRVRPEMVRSDDGTVHWRWSIRGDRIWKTHAIDGSEGEFQIGDAYPLDSDLQSGGSGAWVVEKKLTTTAGTDVGTMDIQEDSRLGAVGMKRVGRNFNSQVDGSGSNTSGTFAVGVKTAPARRFVEVLCAEEVVLPLPLSLPLLRVELTRPDGSASTRTFTLKIDE